MDSSAEFINKYLAARTGESEQERVVLGCIAWSCHSNGNPTVLHMLHIGYSQAGQANRIKLV